MFGCLEISQDLSNLARKNIWSTAILGQRWPRLIDEDIGRWFRRRWCNKFLPPKLRVPGLGSISDDIKWRSFAPVTRTIEDLL